MIHVLPVIVLVIAVVNVFNVIVLLYIIISDNENVKPNTNIPIMYFKVYFLKICLYVNLFFCLKKENL